MWITYLISGDAPPMAMADLPHRLKAIVYALLPLNKGRIVVDTDRLILYQHNGQDGAPSDTFLASEFVDTECLTTHANARALAIACTNSAQLTKKAINTVQQCCDAMEREDTARLLRTTGAH